ncbi:LysR family transcriptional regulator [Pseudomonas typographi]|uniref:LysR family transcriptional regulator n=1 Tax=Pseudomonas typographi TaxID=2715964 RepID=A0ABR7Z7V1_9PSED|nr:LysR family transcriptional regulator [Pseudomonas typographi]MBD1554583.1 LysR family transcriptional regulator [Pseudomonas typographi]MBD1588647.1 LysR family transcriptional regulator [Pseudomonas typographi]MBD1601616.1 LysR family transcriptional regulator [Pseudomonas typographi]
MPRHLDISLLRTFVAVHERGSMTAAAHSLHLTQGAISQHIKRLEDVFGTPLFDRQPRRLGLTRAGDRLLIKARALLELNDEVWAEMTERTISGPVRFGVPYDLMGQALASALKAYEVAWPQAEVSLMCAASSDLVTALERGEIDLALVEEPVTSTQGGRFNVQCLCVERLVWVGASGGSAFSKQPLPVSLVAQTCSFRPAIVSALQTQGRAWRTVYESGNIEATCATVRADLAVTAWLAFTVPKDLQILPANSGLPELPPFAINLYQRHAETSLAASELALSVIRVFRR